MNLTKFSYDGINQFFRFRVKLGTLKVHQGRERLATNSIDSDIDNFLFHIEFRTKMEIFDIDGK